MVEGEPLHCELTSDGRKGPGHLRRKFQQARVQMPALGLLAEGA